MAVTEQTLQEAFRDAFRALNRFEDLDVTINDWSVLDIATVNAPYIIIENSDDWESLQQTTTTTNNYRLPFTLFVKLAADNWKTALDNFRDVRQAVIDACADTGRSAFGNAGVQVTRLRPEGPMGYVYPNDIDPEQVPYATPLFLSQRIIAEVNEF